MYDKIAEITRKFESQIYAANEFYHKAIRRAHNEYHDSLSAAIAPGNLSEPLKEETETDLIDQVFKKYATSTSRTDD